MQSESTSGSGPQPHKVGRKLVVQKIWRQRLASALVGEGSVEFDIGMDGPLYQSGWTMLSPTFQMQNDGSSVLTHILGKTS